MNLKAGGKGGGGEDGINNKILGTTLEDAAQLLA